MEAHETFGRWLQWYFANKFSGTYLAKHGRIPSQNDFAKWLGIKNTNLSQYMNDNRTPDIKQVDIMAERIGPIVYDQLGLPRKMPKDKLLYWIADHWHELSEDEQREILERAKNAVEKKGAAKNNNAFA